MERQKLIMVKLPNSVYKALKVKAEKMHLDVTSYARMSLAKNAKEVKEVQKND